MLASHLTLSNKPCLISIKAATQFLPNLENRVCIMALQTQVLRCRQAHRMYMFVVRRFIHL